MKVALFIIILILIPCLGRAELYISPGIGLTPAFDSKGKSLSGPPTVRHSQALGVDIDLQYLFKERFSFNLGLIWQGGEAIAQYNFVNKKNVLDQAIVNNLDANSSLLAGLLGARIRFLNLDYVKGFAGSGLARGLLSYAYDESQFELATGNSIGFNEKEEQSLRGHYFECGLEILNTKGGAIRFLARQMNLKADKFETLNDKKVSASMMQYSVLYVHPY